MGGRSGILLLSLCVLVAVAFAEKSPATPSFSDVYTAFGTFTLPYANITQFVQVYYDEQSKKERIDLNEGLDSTLYRYDLKKTYEIYTRIDKKACLESQGEGSLVNLFPDFSQWEFKGYETKRGIPCEHWSFINPVENKTNYYGYDVIFGSHYDEYVLDFDFYVPEIADPSAFDIPSICSGQTGSAEREHTTVEMLRAMLPPSDETYFQQFMKKHGKKYNSQNEYNKRLRIFKSNLKYIRKFNKETQHHKLDVNHFADVSFEEFKNLYLPKRGSFKPVTAPEIHVPKEHPNSLPSEVDWRQKGAVTAVKDQGVCGSCWSFSTTGSLEGAHFLSTGELISLSEQQLVDCSWNYGNNGCDGGFQNYAFTYIMKAGGVETEQEYPYIMQDSYCNFDKSKVAATMSSYVNVTSGDEDALKDAVASVGPISVSIDVLQSFVFYSSGVYFDAKCKSDFNDLDHAVLVVGYGTDQSGGDYWIVKNSWSTHWGNDGYVWMARNRNNNCGIATGAMYPVV